MPVVKSLGDTTVPERPTVKVVGCGGAGCNTLRDIPAVPGLDLIGINDESHPSLVGIKNAVYLRTEGLKGIALSSEKVSKQLLTEQEKEIANHIRGADIVYIVSGMGGEMGTWAPTVVAKVARKLGILSIAMTTLPFRVESERRRVVAREGTDLLSRAADCLIVFSNDKILDIAPDLPITKAFYVMGQVMTSPILSFSRVVTKGDEKVLKEAFQECGQMRLGAGDGRGRGRTFQSVKEVFTSPWFEDVAVQDASVAIIFVSSSEAFAEDMDEVILDTKNRIPEADVFYGGYKEEMEDRLRTVVLLGFE